MGNLQLYYVNIPVQRRTGAEKAGLLWKRFLPCLGLSDMDCLCVLRMDMGFGHRRCSQPLLNPGAQEWSGQGGPLDDPSSTSNLGSISMVIILSGLNLFLFVPKFKKELRSPNLCPSSPGTAAGNRTRDGSSLVHLPR
jgi:hypothetical protein